MGVQFSLSSNWLFSACSPANLTAPMVALKKQDCESTMSEKTYNVYTQENGVLIKAWTKGVPVEEAAQKQLRNVAQLPFIYKWVAAMPDVHWGIGATVGSVIPTKG